MHTVEKETKEERRRIRLKVMDILKSGLNDGLNGVVNLPGCLDARTLPTLTQGGPALLLHLIDEFLVFAADAPLSDE